MLRILLANFIVQILPLLMLIAGIVLILRARKGRPGGTARHYIGISLAALPAGVIAYIIAGIVAAAIRGEGHFYSVPFGGYTIDNGPIGISVILWIAFVFAVLAFVLRPRE
jgi:hypothetical protein